MEVSVIMSVYNTESIFLRKAIESILNQSFTDFEFIIVNDGSKKEIGDIIEGYKDDRIVLVQNEYNIGLTKSLNKALNMAKGKYIARMDSDDVSYVKRLEKQYKYMEKYRNIDILGAWIYDGVRISKTDGKISSECRRVRMLFRNDGIIHPTAFIRKSFLMKYGIIYDEAVQNAEDYKLWVDCLRYGATMSVFPEVLLYYRRHSEQISQSGSEVQKHSSKIIQEELIRELYPDISDAKLYLFCNREIWIQNKEEFIQICKELIQKNNTKKIYDMHILKYELKDIYIKYDTTELFDIGYWWYRIRRHIEKCGYIGFRNR